MMLMRSLPQFTLLAATLSALALTACSEQPKTTSSEPPKAVQKQEAAAQQQSNKIQKTTDRAQDSMNQSAQQVKDAEAAAESGK